MQPWNIICTQDFHVQQDIFRARYQNLIVECGLPCSEEAHRMRLLTDEEDRFALHIAAFGPNGLVGALRLHLSHAPQWVHKQLPLELVSQLDAASYGFVSRCFVVKSERGGPILRALCSKAYEIGQHHKLAHGLCHCRPSLLPLYRRMGWSAVTQEFALPNTGPQYILYQSLLARQVAA
jgi:hypothetical protein